MTITVGKGSCGIAAGANQIFDIISNNINSNINSNNINLDIKIKLVGCIGLCYLEPIVEVIDDRDSEKMTFVKVDKIGAEEIIKLTNGLPNDAKRYLISDAVKDNLNHKQKRIALRNSGLINPEDIDEYIESGGYKAFVTCLSMSGDEVIDIIKTSGLAGRGGAGFSTAFKWNACKNSPGDKKYVICNADEGDPGAFMDRAIIESDPHSLIEGMLIAAYAIGADEGIVYVRAEYPLAIKRLEHAITQALDAGYLGENIQGSGFSYHLRIKAGAGAFVCGEETALIASLEGERGMPRLKPPFPAAKGFWQMPTNINNVETYANVAWIINFGGEKFAELGTEHSKGTKVFALTGKINNGGLIEIPMGKRLRDVIFDLGGGIRDGKKFKAVQMGGPSGGCIPEEKLDTLIDYKALMQTGAIMGSGGMVVMDETTCMVDMARFFLDFTKKESCGKCVHCRIGTKRMLEILTRITEGQGRSGDIELLSELALDIKDGSLCGLGQTAPNPVLTTIKYFRNEYEDHINGRCTAHSCRSLIKYRISESCKGCTLCAKKCPVGAISGTVKSIHVVDNAKCTKCGNCVSVCKFSAVHID